MTPVASLWVYLAAQPLFWLALTLAAYLAGDWLAARSGRHPLVNPVMIAIAIVMAVLLLSGTPYERYFEGAQFVHVLLGPATVALAVPIMRHRALIRARGRAIGVALLCGALTGILTAVGLGAALGLPADILLSIAPKSVTAAIAMGIAEKTGGIASLTAVVVIMTGIIGAILVTPLMHVLGIRDYAARGFAAGLASHGIGTARALAVNETAGTFAGLAMALNGLATAMLVPLLLLLR